MVLFALVFEPLTNFRERQAQGFGQKELGFLGRVRILSITGMQHFQLIFGQLSFGLDPEQVQNGVFILSGERFVYGLAKQRLFHALLDVAFASAVSKPLIDLFVGYPDLIR